MPNEVVVAGVGIHPFGRHDDLSLTDLAAVALKEALESAGRTLGDAQAMFVGNALGNAGVAAALADDLGISGIPVTRIEQACASGSAALRLACEAVASGSCKTAIALGVEKMGRGLLQLDDKPSYESRLGLDLFPLLYGLKARQYMDVADATEDDLASLSVKASRLGAAAAHASTAQPVSLEDALASPVIAAPVTRIQCCRNADGAAAAVIEAADGRGGKIRVRSWVGGVSIEDPAKPMRGGWDSREQIVQTLGQRLYELAGIGPADVDVLQINDAFAIAEPLYLEALGFAAPGEGVGLHRHGVTDIGGRLPTNTDGGLLGRGHALGATGLAMLYELVTQLNGQAGSRQVAQPKVGLLQSHGYGGENLFLLAK